jgi:hypothetical protein
VSEWPDTQSLPAHLKLLLRQTSVQLIAAFFVASLVIRLLVGRWSARDLIGPLIVFAAEPITEWVIHVFVLHWRPKTVRGRVLDPAVSSKHRAHHAEPRDLELVLVPIRFLVKGLTAAGAIALGFAIALDRPTIITALVAGYFMLLVYEWTHFLIHSKYRPRHAYYRLIWRHHRNHHFRNEHYWFGVTIDLGDRLLRTAPERDTVPVSPTAKTLQAGLVD